MANIDVTPDVAVAIASLVKMIKLLGAELVAGTHRDDIDLFEKKVREKLFASVDGASAGSTAAGVALAHSLVEPVLRDLRAQAAEKAAPDQSPEAKAAGQSSTVH